MTPASNPTPPTPPHPPSRRVCPGYFTVLHNDRIGSFNIPAGDYRITPPLPRRGLRAGGRVSRSSCRTGTAISSPWHLDPGTGTFQRGRHIGFRIKPYVDANEDRQGRHPSGGQSKCPATFRVLHNDTIGKLQLPKGPYNVWVKGISCKRSTTLFADFLEDTSGVLPRPWRLSVSTGTFRRGKSASCSASSRPTPRPPRSPAAGRACQRRARPALARPPAAR